MAKSATSSSHLQLVESEARIGVQIPLPILGALASAESAFLDLCVVVGGQVLESMMEQDREAACGPKGKHNPDREAVRAGSTSSEITLGGRRIGMRRLRARSLDGEVRLPSFVYAADRDPLDRQTEEALACGVSTRKYARTLDPLPDSIKERSTSKSSVSRRFVALSKKQMTTWLSRPLSDLDLRVMVIDGIHFRDHAVLIVLGIDSDGRKHVLGLREGSTESSGVAQSLLRDLIDRGLDTEVRRVFVIDGSKALRHAIVKVFGRSGLIQRCQIHKRRNILDHLPANLHASVSKVLVESWDTTDAELAKRRLMKLADSLEQAHPGAAASIREGLDDTLTFQRLGITGGLYQTLRSTNTIENLNGSITTYTRNVKRWQGGSMLIRWVSSAVLDAASRFRRVRDYRQMGRLVQALDQFQGGKEDVTAAQAAS
jgi:transposase-like protein